ncbi:unnamed protein product [Brassicogethes aeneus]|uniref:GTPase Era, mitochondrial n=1 Tax=Brassicogethes aeneus TaxID=1431903 RepID=A0A9P0FN45_BRAAE|nr:unnamed protein product [Brassicogethes aeneus]
MFSKIIKNITLTCRTINIKQIRLYSLEITENVANTFKPPEICDTKLLKVAIIGCPNAGKSTFINNLMDRKVCATSSKVHTTRNKSLAIFTVGDSQIVFVDTPGLVNDREKKKFNLEKSFTKDSKSSLSDADIIGVIHDVANAYTREILDIKVIRLLELHKTKPSFLVLNKVDVLKSKRKLLDITRVLTENSLDGKTIPGKFKKIETENKGWPLFKEIFMVSSLTGSGIPEVRDYLIKNAKPNKWMFPEETWTNETPENLVLKAVQATLLNFLPQEIPYTLKPELELFEQNNLTGDIICSVVVKCPSQRIAKLVAGASDGKLKQITETVQHDLQLAFQNFVRIHIVMNSEEKEKT